MAEMDLTKWERKNFDHENTPPIDSALRRNAERWTDEDLRKPIQQLICDVHEEVNQDRTPDVNLTHAIKRMVSMLGRAALEQQNSALAQQRSSKAMTLLTWVIAGLTVLILVMTAAMTWLAFAHR